MTVETRPSSIQYLRDRGFSEAGIDAVGWRVELVGADRCSRYGLPAEAAETLAWFLPYRHANGKIAFERLRLIDEADLAQFGGGKYRQPAGRPLALYDPYGTLDEPQDAVLLIEGEANAVAAHMARPELAVVGLPGQAALTEAMAADLGHIPLIWIWIDRHDKGAEANAQRIARRLRQAGVEDVRQLPDAAGSDANDALRKRGPDRFGSILAEMLDGSAELGAGGDPEEGWPAIAGPRLPGFPLEALPAKLALFVDAVAIETQTPVDLAALVALGVLSASALGAAVVDCGNWEEELGLYILVVMPSGDRKSAVLRSVLAPLRQLEREWRDDEAANVREQRTRQDLLQARKQRLVRKIGDEEDADKRDDAEKELARLTTELEGIGEPVMPRLLADDATPEALAGLLAKHGQIAIIAAEAPIIDNLIGRYDASGAANLHLVCKGYTGEEARVDRRGRDPELLERPLLVMLLTVQPHVLRALIENRTARDQGLVGRFAFAIPESRLGQRDIDPPRVPGELHQAWTNIVRTVNKALELTQQTQSSSVGSVSDRGVGISKLSLSPSARRLLSALRFEQEPRLAEGGELRPHSDWIARHAGRAARIAGLLHLTQHSIDTPIGEETMQNALRIAEYMLRHSVAALSAPDETTRRGLDLLRRHEERSISQRDLHRGVLHGRGPADRAAQLARALVELGALRRIDEDGERSPGRPPSPMYEINPNLRDGPQ